MDYLSSRKSIRLKGYDYQKPGLYFITICTEDNQRLFGTIMEKKIILNDAGKAVQDCWLQIPYYCQNVKLHDFIIMPNHIHGIIEITKPTSAGANLHSPVNGINTNHSPVNVQNNQYEKYSNQNNGCLKRAYCDTPLHDNAFRSPSKTIGSIVRGFKIGVVKWFRENKPKQYPIGTTVWQRNYHDQIIWNDELYTKIKRYIINNPKNWNKDKLKKYQIVR